MGIPKFYRWLSERYPLVNQPGGATVVPIIDNFYLDMNGIIHNCTHGNNPDVHMTEDEMIVRIFSYLDKLFHIVKPQKVIFMAIDGVAPRAKMNQQRARRFKSAIEAEKAAEEAVKRGEAVQDAASRFDSNCITPGTPFMARLGAHLRFFIRRKISEDPAWQKPTVIFSGHEVPGEGEHKIMEYIRWAKRAPGYAPNTRHCLYGLDADLIMLSLVTHEPHFCLLREVVSFGAGGRGQPAREVLENPCQEHFVLFQIGLLRDYFDVEFRSMEKTLPFAYDLERIVDDFVLFCMLVGNDFLPALPTVDINEGSLDTMFALYRRLLPLLGGYLTFAGDLHRGRLEVFMKALAEQEADVLETRAVETEEYEAKKGGGRGMEAAPAWASSPAPAAAGATELDDDDSFALEMAKLALQREGNELELLAVAEGEVGLEDVVAAAPAAAPTAPTMMSREAREMFLSGDKASGLAAWRRRYYNEKLKVGEAGRRGVLESYIQGLHWVLEYYYRGVASWNWFYPHHYAPMASDFTALPSINVKFSLGKPFLPFEQLLAVQPGSSCRLLPEPFRWLMTDTHSPIASFYPLTFDVDCEGKRADWEGVVLIPFIDEEKLLEASRSVPKALLSAEEQSRNRLGDIMVFAHAEGSTELSFCASTLPVHYASVARSNSTALMQAAPPPLPAGERGFVPSFVAGTKVGAAGPPGFPTLRTLSLTGELRRAGVSVFGTTSRKESLILHVKDMFAEQAPGADVVARAVVGQRTWVKWPYLQEAQIVAVSDGKVRAGSGGEIRALSQAETDEWQRKTRTLVGDYAMKQGVDVGAVRLLLLVRPCEGLMRQIDGTVEKRFGKSEVAYPLQVTLRRNPAPDPRFQAAGEDGEAQAQAVLNDGATVLFLGRAHYGCIAKVLPGGPRGLGRDGKALEGSSAAAAMYRIEVAPAPPSAAQAAQAARRILGHVKVAYTPSGQVARRLGVSSRVLGRITSNVWVQLGEERRDKADIGLFVKHGSKGLYVPDYVAPMEPRDQPVNGSQQQQQAGTSFGKGGWAYSDAMVRVLEDYKRRFPWVWIALEKDSNSSAASASSGGGGGGAFSSLSVEQLLPGRDKEDAMRQVAALRKWLKSQPLSRRPLVKPTAKVAPETAVRMLQAALPPRPKVGEPLELENVAPALLMPPLDKGGTASAFAGGSFELGDRVVAVGSSGAPTFGTRGTVVGVYDEDVEVLFDSEFLGGSDLFGRCNGNWGALLPPGQLLNLSRPHAVKAEGASAPKVVRRQPSTTPAMPPTNGGTYANATAAAAAASGPAPVRPQSVAAALAAASSGLQGRQVAPRMPSRKVLDPPEGAQRQKSEGFGMGRGAPPPPPLPPPPPPAHAGAQLLAQLSRGAGNTAPGAAPRPPPPMPPTPLPPPPPPPYMMPPPPAGMMMMPPGAAQGHALLSHLQAGGAARSMPPPPPPPPGPQSPPPPPGPPPPYNPQSPPGPSPYNPGSILLSRLQQGSAGQAPPSAAPSSPLPQPTPPPLNAGSLLLHRLQVASPQAKPPVNGIGAAKEEEEAGDADLLWQLMAGAKK